jgi:hypothetical protein
LILVASETEYSYQFCTFWLSSAISHHRTFMMGDSLSFMGKANPGLDGSERIQHSHHKNRTLINMFSSSILHSLLSCITKRVMYKIMERKINDERDLVTTSASIIFVHSVPRTDISAEDYLGALSNLCLLLSLKLC